MKRIEISEVVKKVYQNDELMDLMKDGLATYNQARKLEGQLHSTRIYGNQTLSVEAKIDEIWTQNDINRKYDIIRYDIIEGINDIVGGNIVDMTGTDKQVARRFFDAFNKMF